MGNFFKGSFYSWEVTVTTTKWQIVGNRIRWNQTDNQVIQFHSTNDVTHEKDTSLRVIQPQDVSFKSIYEDTVREFQTEEQSSKQLG